jgi:hypothetical protein
MKGKEQQVTVGEFVGDKGIGPPGWAQVRSNTRDLLHNSSVRMEGICEYIQTLHYRLDSSLRLRCVQSDNY